MPAAIRPTLRRTPARNDGQRLPGRVSTARQSNAVTKASATCATYSGEKAAWLTAPWPSISTVIATPITPPIFRVAWLTALPTA
ncbi:hypothetical protein G6F31_021429 [Rhizopus arrhizus]|nr:hypothetical protein G6F31_021429 [Rhizopus arrhizus]